MHCTSRELELTVIAHLQGWKLKIASKNMFLRFFKEKKPLKLKVQILFF